MNLTSFLTNTTANGESQEANMMSLAADSFGSIKSPKVRFVGASNKSQSLQHLNSL